MYNKIIKVIICVAFCIMLLSSYTCSDDQGQNDQQAEPNISFNRFERSDTWKKSKAMWNPAFGDDFWQPIYDQNIHVITGASQGSKIIAAVDLEPLKKKENTTLPYEDAITILTLYYNIISVSIPEKDISIIIEPKNAGYDAIAISKIELLALPQLQSDQNEYCFVFLDMNNNVIYQENVQLY